MTLGWGELSQEDSKSTIHIGKISIFDYVSIKNVYMTRQHKAKRLTVAYSLYGRVGI